jgi:hypothetical protein
MIACCVISLFLRFKDDEKPDSGEPTAADADAV